MSLNCLRMMTACLMLASNGLEAADVPQCLGNMTQKMSVIQSGYQAIRAGLIPDVSEMVDDGLKDFNALPLRQIRPSDIAPMRQLWQGQLDELGRQQAALSEQLESARRSNSTDLVREIEDGKKGFSIQQSVYFAALEFLACVGGK